ncbi:hypothetical protein Efla_005652 [Eimeria flavescens]
MFFSETDCFVFACKQRIKPHRPQPAGPAAAAAARGGKMRLTVDLILQSPQYISPSRNWTLSLRGCQVDVVENLGATGDYFECIDLSDNEIIKLNNIPPLPRLTSLILCNNRVARIDADVCENLPNLVSLVLTNNRIERLTDLLPLFKAKKLQRLSLLENPVCGAKYYKSFILFNLPNLRFLDFKRVRDEDRKLAQQTFAGEKGQKLIQEIAPPRQPPQSADAAAAKPKESSRLTPEQLDAIKRAIAKASTLEEINKLENALANGIMPEGLMPEGLRISCLRAPRGPTRRGALRGPLHRSPFEGPPRGGLQGPSLGGMQTEQRLLLTAEADRLTAA